MAQSHKAPVQPELLERHQWLSPTPHRRLSSGVWCTGCPCLRLLWQMEVDVCCLCCLLGPRRGLAVASLPC